jgi:outer membrane protein assembly factor BamB
MLRRSGAAVSLRALVSLTGVLLLCVATARVASAADANQANQNWPQWRGPLCNGVAPDAHPPIEWNEDKNVKWKISVPGSGSSTPIIWGDQIFIHTAIPTGRKMEPPAEPPADASADNKDAKDGTSTPPAPSGPPGGKGGKGMFNIEKPNEFYQFVLLSIDRKTGQENWRKVVAEVVPHEGHHPDHGYASYSPVTDGTCIISYWGSRGLHCYDMQGNLKWEKDLGKMHTVFFFGEGTSPALYGNTVVVNWDHEDGSFIAAFNKTTGEELWRTQREEKTTWATPLIVPLADKTLVVAAGIPNVRAYDLATGKQVWQCGGLKPNAIPSPVTANGIVYAMTGFMGNALLAIKADSSGDLTDTDSIVWKFDKDTPYVPSPLLYDNRLYCYKSNKAILSCFDATNGNRLFGPERLEGIEDAYASPVGADGHIYLVGRNGTTIVINNSDKLEIVSTNKLDEGIDASPAIAGTEIFLRGKEHLFCISQK